MSGIGEELLEGSIRCIRPAVDYINVVWQKLSWYGDECNPNLEADLLRLKEQSLIDELIFFEPELSLSSRENETNKRNTGLSEREFSKILWIFDTAQRGKTSIG